MEGSVILGCTVYEELIGFPVLSAVPIDDAFAVQEEEAHSYLCRIESARGIVFIQYVWLEREEK